MELGMWLFTILLFLGVIVIGICQPLEEQGLVEDE